MYSSTLTGFIPHFYIYLHILIGWYFSLILPCVHHTAKCFLILSYPITPAIMFLLHKTSVEYTRLYSSITEVLIYTVEPRIPCNDVFLSVGLLNRTLSAHEFC